MRIWTMAAVTALVCTAVLSQKARAEEEHPRLIATPALIAKIQGLVAVKGSHHEQALAAIRERVKSPLGGADADDGEAKTPAKPPTVPATPDVRACARRAAELAFLSLFSTDQAERTRLAGEAAELLGKASAAPGRSGLQLATMSLNLGLAYDWAYPAMTKEKRESLRTSLLKVLDTWPKVARYWKGSNKQAVERSAELILMVALCEEKNRAERYAKLKEGLIKDYFEIEYSDLGISQEGLGYTEYPSQFYWPAVYATRAIGDEDFFRAACKHAAWKMGMYTHNFMPHARKFVQFGVDWSSNFDEGWASGLLPTAPADKLPYVLWWYDRHMGLKAPGALRDRFDRDHGGTFLSVLLYPGGIEPKDPTGVFPAMIQDDQGRFLFRNRWQDANDIQVTFAADAHDIPCGWDAPICFAFNLMGHDTRFFGGPGKGAGPGDYSKLMIDGKPGNAKKTGKVIASEAHKDGGYILADGGEQYGELGCTSARRHFLVKFLPDNAALIATLDQVAVDKSRTIAWQGNVGAGKESDEVNIQAAPGGFRLQGRAHGSVRGWVLTPATAKIVAADPVQVSVTGEKAGIMVVLWIGAGEPPVPTFQGEGLGRRMDLLGATLRYDAAKERLIAE